MSILSVSVSHKTTSVDLLSQLAMDADGAGKLAGALLDSEHIDEAVVLSTCNRTEVYASVSRFHGGLDDVTAQLAELAGLSVPELQNSCAVYFDEGAVAHVFAVAAGLDSLIVGESQILGQVRQALIGAQRTGTVGTVLNALFQQALRVGKRVQSETDISAAGRSLVSAAYGMLTAEIGPFTGRRVLVVGAGLMAGLAARTAAEAGASVTCVNRTYERAQRLADSVGGSAAALDELPAELARADVLITCTGARDLFLTADLLAASPVRGVVDLALPADVAPEVADLGIALVNLDRLVREQPGDERTGEIAAAGEIVGSEVADFLGVRRAAQVAPTVIALRSMASEVVAAELSRLDARLPGLEPRERDEVSRTVRRVVEKLLHQPTVRVQELADGPEAVDYAAALRELFALDPQAVAAVMSPDVSR
jgi:glutamyl-tRNA reductase